jgi:small GTP-binding protein
VPTVVIGTAGHIDHGKTSLLRALTGIDADRLPEERARGMTIDVGYAHLAFDDGVELDFVDVPGHDRLIGNMLVGAGEIDAAMLVVAADDGPRPQTIEHLQLLDALGIADGLVIVTKTDVVEPGRVDEVVAAVRALLGATSLASVPVVPVSSVTGAGVPEVRVALRVVRDAVTARLGRDGASGPARLAIDRAFAVNGRGAVVTGTLWGGALEAGSTVRREPGGEELRVREIQVHGAARDHHDGGRTAVNLAGVSAGDLRRGDVLTSDPRVQATDRLLVEARPAATFGAGSATGAAAATGARRQAGNPPKAGATVRLHVGTDQVDATVRRVRGQADALLLNLARETATFAAARAGERRAGRGPPGARPAAPARSLAPASHSQPGRRVARRAGAGPERRRWRADRAPRRAGAR